MRRALQLLARIPLAVALMGVMAVLGLSGTAVLVLTTGWRVLAEPHPLRRALRAPRLELRA